MDVRKLLRLAMMGCVATGCAAIAGLDDPSPVADTSPSVTPDAQVDATPSIDAGGGTDLDADTTTETGTPCTPLAPLPIPSPTMHAPLAAKAPVIDNNFDEWRCLQHYDLGGGEYDTDAMPAADHLLVAAVHTTDGVFVHLVIDTQAPAGTQTQTYLNDSISLFVGPLAVAPSETYRPGDHRLVFDSLGNKNSYQNNVLETFPSGVTAATSTSTNGGVIHTEHEIRVGHAAVAVDMYNAGDEINFGLQLSDRVAATEYRLWHRHIECGCVTNCCYANGKDEPGCDARCVGWLHLD